MALNYTKVLDGCHGVGNSNFYTASEMVVDGEAVVPAAKHIYTGSTERCEDVLIVQAGLPGNWLRKAEAKATGLVRERPSASVLLTVPEGIPLEQEMIRIQALNQVLLWGRGPHAAFFEKIFSMAKFVRQLFAVYKVALEQFPSGCKIHLLGQSYGSAALLYALDQCKKQGLPLPDSANFLSPFVKVALCEDDPALSLSIVNTAVAGVLGKPFDAQVEDLHGLLEMCREVYSVPEDADLVEQHRAVFGRRFFEALDVEGVAGKCDVRVFRGAQDPYVGYEHAELITSRLSGGEVTELPDDGHDLDSLGFDALIK